MTSNARRRSEHQEASAEQSKMRKEYSDVTLTRYTKKSFMPFLPCLLLHHLTNQVGTERTAAFVRTHWSALLLLDISGFTRLSSVIGAEKLKMHCNLYFSNILKIIAKYNGDVLKFLGDALFVIWPVDKDATPQQMAKACAVAAEAACAIMAVGNYDAVDTNPTTHEPVNVKLRLHCALGCGRTNFFHIGTTRRALSLSFVLVCFKEMNHSNKNFPRGTLHRK